MGWSAIKKFLMRIARKVLEGVIAKLASEKRIIQELLEKIRGFFPILRDAWEGDDSEKFIDDVTQRLVPEVVKLIAAVGGIQTSIMKSLDVMDNADTKSASSVQNVRDAFSKIKI
jgi:uncharacterized protein YukE